MSGVGHSMRNCAFVALLVLNSFSLLAADDLKPIVIQMSRDVKMEFQPCPAGTFTMGKENDTKENSCTKAHKVTITRPFLVAFDLPISTSTFRNNAFHHI